MKTNLWPVCTVLYCWGEFRSHSLPWKLWQCSLQSCDKIPTLLCNDCWKGPVVIYPISEKKLLQQVQLFTTICPMCCLLNTLISTHKENEQRGLRWFPSLCNTKSSNSLFSRLLLCGNSSHTVGLCWLQNRRSCFLTPSLKEVNLGTFSGLWELFSKSFPVVFASVLCRNVWIFNCISS